MFQLKENNVNIKQIANFLGINYVDKDFVITSVSSLNNVKSNSILFFSDLINFKFKIKEENDPEEKLIEPQEKPHDY